MPRPPGRARAPGPLDDLEGAPPPPTLSLGARRARSSPRRVVAAGSSAHMDAKVKRLAHRRVPDPHEADPVPHARTWEPPVATIRFSTNRDVAASATDAVAWRNVPIISGDDR